MIFPKIAQVISGEIRTPHLVLTASNKDGLKGKAIWSGAQKVQKSYKRGKKILPAPKKKKNYFSMQNRKGDACLGIQQSIGNNLHPLLQMRGNTLSKS